MELLYLLNKCLTWNNRKEWDKSIQLMNLLFNNCKKDFTQIIKIAEKVKRKIDDIDYYLQKNTSEVCPYCKNVCCINKHGYYDYQDIIYIYAVESSPPVYRTGIEDTYPCHFLSEKGCTIERSKRPFRCNWYFCNNLLQNMENGPAKPYRKFIDNFNEIICLRQKMIENFFTVLNIIKTEDRT